MNSSLNWQKLYEEGRCKEIHVFWNEEEREAIHVLKIPVDYVRSGVTTMEAYAKALKDEAASGKKPLEKQDMATLMGKAVELGVKMSTEITKGTLVREIKARTKIKEESAKQAAALAKAYKKQDEVEAKEGAKKEKAKEDAKVELKKEEVKEVAKAEVEVEKVTATEKKKK